ncbi:MAG: peptidase [Frankiales bacterium]|nr:peptidase [Frankiales bacterium]
MSQRSRRLPARLALLGGAALVAGVLAVPSTAAETAEVTDRCIASVDETDPLEAGPTSICFTVFKPASASASKRVPMVLHSHGWGGSRTKTASSFQSYLDAGFGVLSIDQRGHGESGGKAHVEDPAFEGQDMKKVIDHVATLDWVEKDGPGDPRIGAIGGSYGGGYQFVAAFTEIAETGRTRLDALAPEITWYSLNESLAPNDVVRTAWVSALYSLGSQQHTSTVHAGFAEGVATGNWPSTMDEFFVDNGPKSHVENGEKLDIPVLFGQGATDNLFPLEQGLKNFDRALTPKARAKSIFVGYNGGHALPNALPLGYGAAGDACSKTLGGTAKVTSFATLAQQFLAENLKGEKAQLVGHGQYHLTTADGACTTVASVAPNTSVPLAQPVATTAAAGAPMQIEVAKGPLRLAGSPRLDAVVTALGLDARAFLGLAVGTTAADAKVVQNNLMPHRERSLNVGTARRMPLPSVAVDVPEGSSLFLTVSPVSDMFAAHGSRTPGALLFQDAVLQLPVVKTVAMAK